MAVHSGRFGVVNSVSTVGEWAVNDAGSLAEAVASNTAYGTARRPGVEEWNGHYQNYGVQPPVGQMPGDVINFTGYTAPDSDIAGVGLQYSGVAYLKQLAISWNWAAAEIINMTTDFDGHLALTSTPSTGPTLDASAPNFPQIGGTFFQFSPDGVTWTTWTDLVNATWTLKNSVQPYVNSGTFIAGTPGRFWTGRRVGIFDWSLSAVEQNTDRSRFTKGQQLWLRLYVTATTYWLLKYGVVREFTNITIDRKTGKIISQTVNIDGNVSDFATGALGTITKPDGTVFWPIPQS